MHAPVLRAATLLALSSLCLFAAHAAPPTPPPGDKKEADNQIEVAATAEGFERVDVYSTVAGYIDSQSVDIGDRVKKGDVLAQIENSKQRLALEMKKAELAEAEAMLDEVKQEVQTARGSVEQARLRVRSAGVVLDQSRRRCAQAKAECARLKKDNSDEGKERLRQAQAQLEDYQSAEQQTEIEVEEARLKVADAGSQVEQIKKRVASAQARVRVARAGVAEAQADLDRCTLRAPFDGVVTERRMFPGDFIREGSTATTSLLQVTRVDRIRIVFPVPGKHISRLEVGARVHIRLDALPNRDFQGKVARFSPQIEAKYRTFRVEVDLDNAKGEIQPGMYGYVRVELAPAAEKNDKDR